MLEIVLALNALWFAMGFSAFAVRGKVFAKVFIAREHRDTPVFEAFIHSGKFLGGFNLACSALNIALLVNTSLFDQDLQWAILLLFNALAHGTQFAYNVPVALAKQPVEGIPPVKGVMLFIFVNDFILMAVNGIFALTYLL